MNTAQIPKSNRSAIRWLWLSVCVVLLDQLSKYWVTHNFTYNTKNVVLPFLNLTVEHNKGAAFNFLAQQGNLAMLLFIGVALVVSLLLCIWLFRIPVNNRLLAISIALLLGGALGNLIDRIIFGYVIDFIHFHLNTWNFAIFNVADTAITIGAFLMIIDIFTKKK